VRKFVLGRKHAVETTEMLDFLKEIVQGVPDPSAGGTIDLENAGEAEGGKKRRGHGKGKRNGAAGAEGGEAAPKRRRKKKGEVVEAAADMDTKSEPEEHPGAPMEQEELEENRTLDDTGHA
jgi:hypothetical protein